MESLIIDQVPI